MSGEAAENGGGRGREGGAMPCFGDENKRGKVILKAEELDVDGCPESDVKN